MTVIVRDNETNKIMVLTKGADTILLPLIKDDEENNQMKQITTKHLQSYAEDGLRTLLLCHKTIDELEYREWAKLYDQAKCSIANKELKIKAAVAQLEHNFDLLGATAIEDQLQDDVGETITSIKKADIKFWMLTGDKMETAINIGYSCKVLDNQMQIFKVEQNSKQEIMNFLTGVLRSIHVYNNKKSLEKLPELKYGTVIEGESFFKIQQSKRLIDCFMQLALTSQVVIACRLSPKQKAEVIKLIKEFEPNKVTLAIGDGANDVSMITEAHIGIGISGNEGNQAVSSSDYALGQFKDLKTLLLFHGREAYRRNAYMICYIFYKNLLQNMPIIMYGLVSGFSG